MKKNIIFILLFFVLTCSCVGFLTGEALAQENTTTQNEEVQWWWKKDKASDSEQGIPELKGGSEADQRVQEPLGLDELQARYPDTVFLHGPTTENRVALTFDDGPDPRFTPEILDILAEYNIPATFFLMGARAEESPELARRITEEGHVVGNHTFWHPDLVEEGDIETLVNEVTRTEDTLAGIIDYRTTLFRPPYGFLYDELVEELQALEYSVIAWSVDSLDWQNIGPQEIAQNVLEDIHPGAIILMHDGAPAEEDRTETIESLREIIPVLQEQGYEFVTVPDLLNIPYQR
ncbi:polysaccharide deacetylase family protein [Bacillus sp. FJAT-44742]|uniref:polysaccharide deacetylase family protein n=1 Tax=Bacillus sp. FJAT-44742 TaxID=2014005 RepID=UPI000C23D422|nr:polysaccharide deacetylase family protein [Bacillus sp. FJAT-44742]